VLDHPVGLNSRPGEGSVFFVTAPIGAAAPTSLAENGAPQPLPGGEPLSGLKILAIDNDPRVLEGTRSLMSRWGCLIATAHGLVEARDLLAGFGAPDVIIADYHLDQGDGIEGDPRLARGLRPDSAGDPRHRRPMHWPMHQASRCHARSKRSGLQCRAPAVRRMHGAAGGAPKGNRNALKHGGFTAEMIALRKEIISLARLARETMAVVE
jgi:hypothetical protein